MNLNCENHYKVKTFQINSRGKSRYKSLNTAKSIIKFSEEQIGNE